jgi:hypothetical protein
MHGIYVDDHAKTSVAGDNALAVGCAMLACDRCK